MSTRFGVDDVRGEIIGEITHDKYYSFYREGVQVLAGDWFPNDAAAIEWVRSKHPAKFAAGLEMRVRL